MTHKAAAYWHLINRLTHHLQSRIHNGQVIYGPVMRLGITQECRQKVRSGAWRDMPKSGPDALYGLPNVSKGFVQEVASAFASADQK